MKIEFPELVAINQKVSQLAADISRIKESSGAGYDPHDRLVRVSEAAKILGVNKSAISRYVRDGMLTPYYVPHSSSRRFRISDVWEIARRGSIESN